MPNKDVSLKIEHFYNNEDMEFHVSSRVEMLSILRDIAKHGAPVALYYGNEQNFIQSTLLDVNEQGMWLDATPFPPEHQALLSDGEIAFVSAYHHLKIQFVVQDIETDLFEGKEAFYLGLPDHLLRIQRRECFRTAIPPSILISCIIPVRPKCSDDPVVMRNVPVVDISCDGIGLLCGKHESTLLPEKIFRDCQISVPDIGILKVAIEVRNGFQLVTPDGEAHTYVGCRFLHLDNKMNILLQRYITHLQGESVRAHELSPQDEDASGEPRPE